MTDVTLSWDLCVTDVALFGLWCSYLTDVVFGNHVFSSLPLVE